MKTKPPVDEQGESFPPDLCPAVLVDESIAGPSNLGEIAGYNKASRYYLVNSSAWPTPLVCEKDELTPLNQFARDMIDLCPDVPIFDD